MLPGGLTRTHPLERDHSSSWSVPTASARLEDFDELLEEEERGLAGADGEGLLHFLSLFAAEGRIGVSPRRGAVAATMARMSGRGV